MHTETRCRSVHALGFTTEQKNCGKSGLGYQASRPPGRGGPRTAGRRAVVGRGPRAAGPSGRRAAGPWASGRWAAGLLLAKPSLNGSIFVSVEPSPI